MSHGKKMYLKGTATVDIGGRDKAFSSEESYGIALSHGKITGDPSKAQKNIVNDLNAQIQSAWKKAKLGGDAPEVDYDDIEWDTFSAK